MVGKKYRTLLITPSNPEKRIIMLSLPPLCGSIFFVIVAAILFWAGIGTWSFCHHQKLTQRSLCLEKEHQLAKSQVKDEKQKVEYLNKQLKRIRAQADFIQNFLGLRAQDKADGRIGQGGVEISPQDFILKSDSSPSVNPSLLSLYNSAQTPHLSSEEVARLGTDLDQIIDTLQNRQKELEHMPSISPVDPQKSWISSSYGMRTSQFTGKKQFHPGIDIAGWKGTPIMAPANGKVISVKKNGSMGLVVKIRHDSIFTTAYGHLLKAAVKKRQYVKRGDIIGYMGNSGRSTGYHLHYEVKKNGKRVNPFHYMMDWDKEHFLLATEQKETGKNKHSIVSGDQNENG
jgi:murein DD-endopeptidase MepM/ murein hydrolase activator NlpD